MASTTGSSGVSSMMFIGTASPSLVEELLKRLDVEKRPVDGLTAADIRITDFDGL